MLIYSFCFIIFVICLINTYYYTSKYEYEISLKISYANYSLMRNLRNQNSNYAI